MSTRCARCEAPLSRTARRGPAPSARDFTDSNGQTEQDCWIEAAGGPVCRLTVVGSQSAVIGISDASTATEDRRRAALLHHVGDDFRTLTILWRSPARDTEIGRAHV